MEGHLSVNELDKNRHTQLGLKIAYYRKLKGYTQAELAQKVGISTKYLSQIEAPRTVRSISMNTLFAFSNEFDISPNKLLNFDDDI